MRMMRCPVGHRTKPSMSSALDGRASYKCTECGVTWTSGIKGRALKNRETRWAATEKAGKK